MPSVNRQLYCLPCSQPMEAPSSWIARAALSQGVTTAELLEHLQINRDMDIDLGIVFADQERLREACGLPPHHLDLSIKILKNLVKSKCEASRFLLHSKSRGLPRFRYCPQCLHERIVPSLPIHWRFAAFRYCPDHSCMLEERCHACKADVAGAVSLVNAGPDRKGIAFLRHCTACGIDLRAVPSIGQSEAFSLMGRLEQDLMRNGRAVLAALYLGYVRDSRRPDVKSALSRLHRLDKMTLLPNKVEWNSTDFLKLKLVRRLQQHAQERDIDAARLGEITGMS